jgi:copper ion binding protein
MEDTHQGYREEAEMETVYTVKGMTCGHCVNAVSAEIGKLDGVAGVTVDLATGAVTVTSEAPLDRAAVAAAVEEAGYELVS